MKKYYCKKCRKEISYNGAKYGSHLCMSCVAKKRLSNPKNNPNYKHGKYCEINYCIEKNCNIKIGANSKRCKYHAGKKHSIKMRGKNNPNYENPYNMKGKNHPRYKDGNFLIKHYCIGCHKEIHPYASHCYSCANIGDRNPNYIHGKGYEPYPLKFNNRLKTSIRNRDNYTCQKCGITEKNYKRNLDIHHIDYNKQNCKENNLIALCNLCNNRVNKNRDYWISFFKLKLKRRKKTWQLV